MCLGQIRGRTTTLVPAPQLVAPVLPLIQDAPLYPGPVFGSRLFSNPYNDASLASDPGSDGRPPGANDITDGNLIKKGHMFCFGAFADNHMDTLHKNLTELFPFMSLDGNVCYLIVYHYETNAILALPIAHLEDTIIFEGY
jgi:hypothetical protein